MSKDPYKLNRDTYNSLAEQYQEKFMNWDGYHKTYDTFLKALKPEQTLLLEIGCGPGNVTRYLLDKRPNLKIHGIDIAPNMISLAEKNNPQACYEVMDSRNIDSLKRKYDSVMIGFCTPYINKEDTLKLIKDAGELMNTQGILYLSTMEDDYSKSGIKGSPNHDAKVFIYYHELDYLKQSLVSNGFEVIHEIRQEYKEQEGSISTDLFLIARKK